MERCFKCNIIKKVTGAPDLFSWDYQIIQMVEVGFARRQHNNNSDNSNNNNTCDFSFYPGIPPGFVEQRETGVHLMCKRVSLAHSPKAGILPGDSYRIGGSTSVGCLRLYSPTQAHVTAISLTHSWLYTSSNSTPDHTLLIMNLNAYIFILMFICF